MSSLLEELARQAEMRREQALDRRLEPASGIDFCSNDYLGFAADGQVAATVAERCARSSAAAMGVPASRLLRGTTADHLRLEERLARFKGAEAGLLFATGYQANLGLLTALLGPEDRVLSDELNHASLIDGIRLSGCRKVIFPHLDLASIERELARPHPGGRTFLVTESLFSMDGDVAPLDRYAELAARYGASLLVDEAHATGLFGARGSGLVGAFGIEERVAAVTTTFGKALGAGGAVVTGPQLLIDHLVNRARSFIFTTAPPPMLLWAVEAALDRLESDPAPRRRALALAARLREKLENQGLARPLGEGPIVPVQIGGSEAALAVADRIRRAGFDVRAVRPPTVPPGTARLRLSVHASRAEEEIDRLALEVAAAVRAEGLVPVPEPVPMEVLS